LFALPPFVVTPYVEPRMHRYKD